MSIQIDKATSRPLGVASKLANQPLDAASIYAKHVVLTGESFALQTPNGRWCFLDALALLARVVGRLSVIVPNSETTLYADAMKQARTSWSHSKIDVFLGPSMLDLSKAHAILNVGCCAESNLPWTVINANGWVARVSSSGEPLPSEMNAPNPLAALLAASLGVAEVFKRVFDVPADVAPMLGKTQYSLYEHSSEPTGIGPSLPTQLTLPPTLLLGAGAIGNGIALLLSQLLLVGRLHIVDKQDYADENLGTCILLGWQDWLGKAKALRLADWISDNSALHVTAERAAIQDASLSAGGSKLRFGLILNGLDDVDARHYVQGLWPDVIIDGGISDVGAAVIQHRIDWPNAACLKCWFTGTKKDEREIQSDLTGLHISSLSDLSRVITDSDIEKAMPGKREQLRANARVGKTLCSIISEAMIAAKLGVQVEENFRPSVPFVATASAAMVVAEMIKAYAFPDAETKSLYQIADLFQGPDKTAIGLRRSPMPTCQCVVHRSTILSLQQTRRQRNS